MQLYLDCLVIYTTLRKKSQFSYCPVVWMFYSRASNNMINKLYERSLRIILNDYSSDFEVMLESNNGICSHHRNIQAFQEFTTKRKGIVWYLRLKSFGNA